MDSPVLCQDERPIEAIARLHNGEWSRVGFNGVTKIEPYEENGPYCMLPMIAVYRGEKLVERIFAFGVEVMYEVTP